MGNIPSLMTGSYKYDLGQQQVSSIPLHSYVGESFTG